MIAVSYANIWTVCRRRLPSGILLIVAGCGCHADSDARRLSKPGPDRALPIYMVNESGCGTDDWIVAAVTTSQTAPYQLETLIRWLLPSPVVPTPPPKPVTSSLEQLLQHWLVGAQAPKPAPPAKTGSSDIESLLQRLLPGTLDWATVVCFSCGKAGHGATRCPDLNKAFPFMLPGWKADKVGGSYVMISPTWQRSAAGREMMTDPGRRVSPRISNRTRPQEPSWW